MKAEQAGDHTRRSGGADCLHMGQGWGVHCISGFIPVKNLDGILMGARPVLGDFSCVN